MSEKAYFEDGGINKQEDMVKMPSFYEYRAEQDAIINAEAQEDKEKVENFNKLVDFFKTDLNIKKTLVELAPRDDDYYDAVSYQDRLYKGFGDLCFDLGKIMRYYYPSEEIEKRLEYIRDSVTYSSGFEELKDTYKEDFTDMRGSFVDAVKKEVGGYSLYKNPHVLDNKAKSINEMLHLIHSSIVNDEGILQDLPVLAKKDGGSITLYGIEKTDTPLAREIFDLIKGVDASSTIDIVSLKDRILMMARDRGHALTIDIQEDPSGKHYVEYFIPKICNVDKINRLPGINKVIKEDRDQSLDAATGGFMIDNKGAAQKIIDFVGAVPTDDDIEHDF